MPESRQKSWSSRNEPSHQRLTRITIRLSLPGVQVYTANFLGEDAGKGGINLYRHQGFCMETQFFPDSPNHPEFPSTRLKAREAFHSVTEYRFTQT